MPTSPSPLRDELYAAQENRGVIYALFFDELRKEIGRERAMNVLKRALYRRGQQIGQQFKRFAPDDFQGLCEDFLAGIPDQGRMFDPTVTRCDREGLEITFDRCPLKNAWKAMGLPDEDMADLCECAGLVDTGAFEAAGFGFELTALPQGEKDRCRLKVTRKKR